MPTLDSVNFGVSSESGGSSSGGGNNPSDNAALITASGLLANFSLDTIYHRGKTLLWDLLQDDKVGELGEALAVHAERTLCNIICFSSEKRIRIKFIEGRHFQSFYEYM